MGDEAIPYSYVVKTNLTWIVNYIPVIKKKLDEPQYTHLSYMRSYVS